MRPPESMTLRARQTAMAIAVDRERERNLRYMHMHFVRGVWCLFMRTDPADAWQADMHFRYAAAQLELARSY